MLLVIPGRKWNLLLYALGSSNYNTSLQGIFKLMTLDLSSTKTFNLIFQVDPSQWILATTALNKTHLTVLHAIFRWVSYQNVDFCYPISLSGGQYKVHGDIDNAIKVFMTESPQIKLCVCIYSFINEWRHRLRNLNQNTGQTTPPFLCWSHDATSRSTSSTIVIFLFYFNILVLIFNFFSFSALIPWKKPQTLITPQWLLNPPKANNSDDPLIIHFWVFP